MKAGGRRLGPAAGVVGPESGRSKGGALIIQFVKLIYFCKHFSFFLFFYFSFFIDALINTYY